ncbi:hypothetical protein F441_21032 [Phytophthora nicotianae CJ01A1]|uniref:Uncharacterized protein n=1 Tax=Phytophthora nicotianae CJ01A1 TaxID=1317063 RepID=W2VU30_PHYNI|nr:hypothetical protein F441_21032 [Phytophthora nicotianae CJ01A1]
MSEAFQENNIRPPQGKYPTTSTALRCVVAYIVNMGPPSVLLPAIAECKQPGPVAMAGKCRSSMTFRIGRTRPAAQKAVQWAQYLALAIILAEVDRNYVDGATEFELSSGMDKDAMRAEDPAALDLCTECDHPVVRQFAIEALANCSLVSDSRYLFGEMRVPRAVFNSA